MRVLHTEDLEKMVTKLSPISPFTEHIHQLACCHMRSLIYVLMEPGKFAIESTLHFHVYLMLIHIHGGICHYKITNNIHHSNVAICATLAAVSFVCNILSENS